MKEKLFHFLDTMSPNKRFRIKPEHKELIFEWMDGKDFDGGVSFSEDWNSIYKCELPIKAKRNE